MCIRDSGNAFNSSFTDCYNVGAIKGGGIAAVDYDSIFASCGYSDTSAEYALKTSDGTELTATNGIFIFTSDDIQKDNGRNWSAVKFFTKYCWQSLFNVLDYKRRID